MYTVTEEPFGDLGDISSSTMSFLCLFMVAIHLHASSFALTSSWCNRTSPPGSIPSNALYFNTKSRYEELNPYLISDILAVNESWVKPPSPDCKAVHLSAIIRHGTRYPSSGNIKKIIQFSKLVKSQADLSCVKELHNWRMWYKEDMDGRLVEKGRLDHRHLAQRLIKSFPTLITKENIEGGRVKLITSSKHRCVNSTLAFKHAVMESLSIRGVDLPYTINDELMRFFDKCERLVETVEKNKDAIMEVEVFKDGPEMKRVQEKLADRLQLPYINVTTDAVETVFYLCAYEFTIRGLNSPWCQLLDDADGQVLEYAGDLKQFWKRGFGHDINSKSSCILFHDLFKRLDTVAQQIRAGGRVSEVVMVQVGHAETLLPLLTLLDLFKDDTPLNSSNFAYHHSRMFRSGKIVPYAANLLMTLFNCPDGLRLQARLNERPLTLPGLAELSPLYQTVRERYKQLLQGCNQDTVCRLNS
ncbi:multiple inositol polyphosphate phosphatase 1-like [Tachysurus vachellii]|uniref:multiple inositol polyphosphate phosphatase 1-like n=1 Tax=Tachysurus vachellii TaxID=175792 RepID=UPI00296AF27E|nr:multiple inositol polyphosphate phosphatase 1-like [Tachysurus vachellii]